MPCMHPSQGDGAPQLRLGGHRPREPLELRGQSLPLGETPKNLPMRQGVTMRAAMPSLSTAGRPGWMPPTPTGPTGQRCSITNPRQWPGGSAPPHRLFCRGWPGRQGSGVPPSVPHLRRPARATRAKGPKAPRTLVTRATGDSVQHGLLEPPANQGETRETGPLLHAPRHPPAASHL